MLLPSRVGSTNQLAWECSYVAAPYTIRTRQKTGLLIYRTGYGHVTRKPQLRIRRRLPGGVWSMPAVLSNIAAPGGLAVEGDGPRIWCALAGATRVSAGSAKDYWVGVIWSDDDGRNWTTSPSLIPDVVPGSTVAGSLCWHDGTLYASTYGIPTAAGGLHVCRVHASTDRGLTWTLRATVGVPGKAATEPTLVSITGNRLAMLMRVAGNEMPPPAAPGTFYYDYIYTTVTDDPSSWPPPTQEIYFASGLPNAKLLPDGRLIVVHRGATEGDGRPMYRTPLAVSLLNADGKRFTDWRAPTGTERNAFQQLDLVGWDDGRWPIYGDVLLGVDGEPDELVFSMQHDQQPNATSNEWITAGLYRQPFEWLDSPSFDVPPLYPLP